MRIERTIAAVAMSGGVLLCTGCAGFGHLGHWSNPPDPSTKVTVRFVAGLDRLAQAGNNPSIRLAASDAGADIGNDDPFATEGDSSFRVMLWGGDFHGEDVTFAATPLSTGPYMFGLFDPDRGSVYQGWISVNTTGDDVLTALEEWRQSVRKQQGWLAYEAKVSGDFESPDSDAFSSFEQNLRELRRLERRVARAINFERTESERHGAEWYETLAEAEVLIVPGGENFLRPWTRPALTQEELSTVRAGTPLTKFVLVGDYATASGKLQRVADLRDDLDRNRAVFTEEIRRLERRRRYYRITDHLYHHGNKPVVNERRLQEARGMIVKLDRQIDDYNQKFEAILFVTGLFAPDDALAQFDARRDALNRKRAVVDTRVAQIESKIADVSDRSDQRIRLEQHRQDVHADLKRIEDRIAQIDQAERAVRLLRDSTAIIHRRGPASVIAATMLDSSIPPRFASAIERESLLTVRLQVANSPHRLNQSQSAMRTTAAAPTDWNRVYRDID